MPELQGAVSDGVIQQIMQEELVVCIPGSWENREEFLKAIIVSTGGKFMFAGGILAHPDGKDHVELEFYEADAAMEKAFEYAGRGKISEAMLARISQHKSVVYLFFPFDFIAQKDRLAKFTKVLSQCGGIAVKVESSGVAHEWNDWFEMIESDNPFDQYRAAVVLVADENYYYSCGMHNFDLPDSQISNQFTPEEAAELINMFNFWRIFETPILESGHTFSLKEDGTRFRLNLSEDERHAPDDLFHNSKGVWSLTAI